MVKKQPKKRGWRKADIGDVEDAMEDDRLVDKLKRGSVKGKGQDDEEGELFTVDTEGSKEHLSAKTRREIARAKLFPPKAPKIGLSASEEAKIARAEGALKTGKSQPSSSSKKGPDVFDLWDAPIAPVKKTFHHPPPKQTPKTLHQKVSAAPAVLPAHEGQSMNPQTEAYEELLCTAAAKQLEAEREDEALDRKMRPFTYELRDLVGEEALKGKSEEEKTQLYQSLKGQQAAEGEEDEGGAAANALKLRLKSQAQRNKERKRKDLDAKQAQQRAQRKLAKSVGDLGAIQKEMMEEEDLQAKKREYKLTQRQKRKELEEKEGVVPHTRRLGRTKFKEEALVVPDAEAASKGLRGMPLKSSAVKERLSSIVRRGMLPAPLSASRGDVIRFKKAKNRLKNSRKYKSPLLRDNLLLR